MPQVWLTYEELGEHFRCEPTEVRTSVNENGWPRRRCSDDLTRVKLPPGLTHEYMLMYARKLGQATMTTDEMVASLRSVLELAKEPTALPMTQSELVAR